MATTTMAIIAVKVQGESGKAYDVTVDANGAAHCSCPSARYRSPWCKHLAFVFDTLEVAVESAGAA